MQIITRREAYLQKEYETVCKKCESRLRFKKEEIQLNRTTRFYIFEFKEQYIQCPVCESIIYENEFIPYPPPSGGSVGRRDHPLPQSFPKREI